MNKKELLISRVIDQEASRADWEALDEIGARDEAIWRDVVSAMRGHAELCAQAADATQCADDVDVPVSAIAPARAHPTVRMARWSGWGVAAAIVVAWAILGGAPPQAHEPAVQTVAFTDPAEALDYYVTEGRRRGIVIGELPRKVLLDVAPSETGDGASVLYLRQIIETADVDAFYTLTSGESGGDAKSPTRVYLDMPSRPG